MRQGWILLILYLFLYFCQDSNLNIDSVAISDRIGLDIDIINIRFEYSNTDTISDVKYPNSDTDKSEPL
jgi:hypothetical protein